MLPHSVISSLPDLASLDTMSSRTKAKHTTSSSR